MPFQFSVIWKYDNSPMCVRQGLMLQLGSTTAYVLVSSTLLLCCHPASINDVSFQVVATLLAGTVQLAVQAWWEILTNDAAWMANIILPVFSCRMFSHIPYVLRATNLLKAILILPLSGTYVPVMPRMGGLSTFSECRSVCLRLLQFYMRIHPSVRNCLHRCTFLPLLIDVSHWLPLSGVSLVLPCSTLVDKSISKCTSLDSIQLFTCICIQW